MKRANLFSIKILVVLFTISLMPAMTVFAQCEGGCLPEGISFKSQQQIDDFVTEYPDCHKIIGNVNICGLTIDNLFGLSNIDTIMGSLSINNCPLLNSFEGLNNLEYIGGYRFTIRDLIYTTDFTGLEKLRTIKGDLYVYSMTSLSSFNGLSQLDTIGRYIFIHDNPELYNFEGLESLKYIGSSATIDQNNSLTSFTGLEMLQSIHGKLQISNNNELGSISSLSNINGETISTLGIYNNPSLCFCETEFLVSYLQNPKITDIFNNGPGCGSPAEIASTNNMSLSGLPMGNYHFYNQKYIDSFPNDYSGCSKLNGNVYVSGSGISNLNGLSGVTSISQAFEITDSPEIINLDGLEALDSIGWWFYLYDNNSLENINALSNLSYTGNTINICCNAELKNLDGLSGLKTVNGDLLLGGSEFINNINGINNIENIEGNITIAGFPNLNNLTGFPVIETIHKNLCIYNNDLIKDLHGLESITTIGGSFKIEQNDSLQNFHGLSNISEISEDLRILSNETLEMLTGINTNSFIVGGDIEIFGNSALKTLTGLENIEWEGNTCRIYNNPELININGFSPSDTDWNHFFMIENNEKLSLCASEYICAFMREGHRHIYVNNNAPGCNFIEEIEEACETVGMEDQGQLKFTLYPNPATEKIHLELSQYFEGEIEGENTIIIYDLSGNRVLEHEICSTSTEIDIRSLLSGVYQVVVCGEERIRSERLIVY